MSAAVDSCTIHAVAGLTKDQVIAYLSALQPSELQDLILELEDHWGIERLAVPTIEPLMGMPIDMGMPAGFDVVLTAAGSRRLEVMKVLRQILGLGLREVKAMVDATGPVVLRSDLDRGHAVEIANKLRGVGAEVEVR